MERPTLIPDSGERALVVGQTGSGKTAFVVWLLYRIPTAPIIIYDTKDEAKFRRLPNSKIVVTTKEVAEAYQNEQIDYIIVQPPVELLGQPQDLDEYLWFHYQHLAHSVCYIDEAYSFMGRAGGYRGLIALLSRGRSRGITTIISSQRPSRIDRLCITEAQKLYVFRLGDRQDRKRLADVIPNFDDYKLPPKHGFYFFQSGEESPTLFGPVKLDRQLDTGYVDLQPESENKDAHTSIQPALTKHLWV